MNIRSDDMLQVATYWPPGVNDGTGGLDFSGVDPLALYVRWEDAAKLFRDASGREFVSEAIVYSTLDVAIRGYIALGDFTGGSGTAGEPVADPRTLAGAYEIRQKLLSPSLSTDEGLVKAIL